jgi:diguanylate cyclase (GGDEF)-like protein
MMPLFSTAMAEPLVAPLGKPLILIVDDQPSNRQLLYQMFRDDCEISIATNGREALAFCQITQPQLILLDVCMQGMDGYEVCRRLKNDPLTHDIAVIFVTGQNDPSEEVRGLDEGGADFIVKPLHAKVVRARVRTQLTLKYQSDLLRSLALTDELSGVANRRHFDIMLLDEWRRGARTASPLALIMIDIDFFKQYNDHYGHQAGDTCLKAIASTLKEHVGRSGDTVARYGGDEFVCILPNTTLAGAEQKARELETAVQALRICHAKSEPFGIATLSIGVAATHPDRPENMVNLLVCADTQLYLAKQAGRGQVRSSQC